MAGLMTSLRKRLREEEDQRGLSGFLAAGPAPGWSWTASRQRPAVHDRPRKESAILATFRKGKAHCTKYSVPEPEVLAKHYRATECRGPTVGRDSA